MNVEQLTVHPGNSLDFVSDLALLGATAIWGIGISQTFRFCIRHAVFSFHEYLGSPEIRTEKEPRALKLFVAWLCIADTLRQIFTIYSEIALYFNTFAFFIEPVSYKNSASPVCVIMPYLFTALVAGSAQTFFAYRLWIVSGFKWFIPVLTTPAILVQLSIPPIYFRTITSNAISNKTQKDLLITSLVVGAVTDVLLSVSLCSLLWRHFVGTNSILRSTKVMLQRMMLFSINTGMWTALLATSIVIVFFRTITDDFMVFGYFHLLSPLYFATVLANLNARHYINGVGDISILSIEGSLSARMEFEPVDLPLDRLSYRDRITPPLPPWHLRGQNPSSEALNPCHETSERLDHAGFPDERLYYRGRQNLTVPGWHFGRNSPSLEHLAASHFMPPDESGYYVNEDGEPVVMAI